MEGNGKPGGTSLRLSAAPLSDLVVGAGGEPKVLSQQKLPVGSKIEAMAVILLASVSPADF